MNQPDNTIPASSSPSSSRTEAEVALAPARPKWSRWGTRAVFGTILLFILSQPFLWNWDSPFGPSIPSMISQSMAIFSVFLLLLWVLLFSGWSFRSRLLGLIPFVILAVGLKLCIRELDQSGDVWIDPVWIWEPTQAERIAQHKAQLGAAPSGDAFVSETSAAIAPEDSPAYRGSQRDGVVIGPPVQTAWAEPPKPLWQQPVGAGYGSMAVVGDRLITIEQRDDDEVVVCYQASTGRELWLHKYPAKFWEAMGGPGPRSTPTIEGDLVFAQGAEGELTCLDLATGKPRWSQNVLKLCGLPNTQWGMTPSPLVVDQKVIANAGGKRGDGLIAFDIASGNVVWKGGGLTGKTTSHAEGPTPALPNADDSGHEKIDESRQNRPGYSSPMLTTFLGVRQIINFDGTAVRGHDPETGHALWSHPYENGPAVNVAQPILFEDGRVFLSASYGVGSAMIQVSRDGDTWKVTPLWDNKNLRCKFTSPVLFEDHIYGMDEGILVCLDAKTGERRWKRGRYYHGQMMLTNGVIVILTEDGRCVFVEPTPQEQRELGSFQALSSDHKTWNPPVLVRGKLYVRNHHDMACYDLTKAQ